LKRLLPQAEDNIPRNFFSVMHRKEYEELFHIIRQYGRRKKENQYMPNGRWIARQRYEILTALSGLVPVVAMLYNQSSSMVAFRHIKTIALLIILYPVFLYRVP
jgi:hypothetical protein